MTDPRMIANTREPMHHPWPADCMVQGGGSGVVFRKGDAYRTAFVEAFPGTFLRGEGPTIADAEDACWAQYEVLAGCAHDQGFDRRHYVNGAGYCRACGSWFGPRVTGFEPLPEYYAPSRHGSLMERAFGGDEAAVGEILSAVARVDELPEAPPAAPDTTRENR
jgi:hypothetical protein